MPSTRRRSSFRALSAVWLLVAAALIAAVAGELWLRLEREKAWRAAARYRDGNVFYSSALSSADRSVWAKPWFKYRANARAEVVVAGQRFRIEINSRGYRTHEFILPKPAGQIRVVCIGGSTTVAGRTNDETYPALLEAKLRARHPGLPIEVLNLGTSGVTSEYWQGRFDRVLALEPDVVVHYEGINDISWWQLPRYARNHRLRAWVYRSLLLERLFPFPLDDFTPYLSDALDARDAMARSCREHGIDYLAGSFAAPDYGRASEDFRSHLDISTEFWTRRFPMHAYATYVAILARYNQHFMAFVNRRHLAHVLVHQQIDDPALFIDVCHFTPEGIARLADVLLPGVDALIIGRPGYRRWAQAAAGGMTKTRGRTSAPARRLPAHA